MCLTLSYFRMHILITNQETVATPVRIYSESAIKMAALTSV